MKRSMHAGRFTGRELYESRQHHKGVPHIPWGDLFPAHMGQWVERARLMSRRCIVRNQIRIEREAFEGRRQG